MKAQISPVEPYDLSRLCSIEEQIFNYDRITRRQFRYLLTKANGNMVKAEYNGELAGYMVLLRRKCCSSMRIYSLGVVKSARKRGIARNLLAYAEMSALHHRLDRLTLEVCENNDCAMRLYYYAGFRLYGRKSDYYENGCSALLLKKSVVSKDTIQ